LEGIYENLDKITQKALKARLDAHREDALRSRELVTLRDDVAIDPDAVDPEDAEMLAEMVQAAVNEAIRAAQELAASKMPEVPGMPGLGGGGLPGG